MLEVLISIKENIKKIYQSPNNFIKNFISLENLIQKDLNEIIPICTSPSYSSNEKDKLDDPEFIKILKI